MKVRDLSEEALLSRFVPLLPSGDFTELGPGDDCAIVSAPGARFVVTTDVLVENHHFLTTWSTGREIGKRAAAQNLADVAAMGAVPTSLVISLVLPPETPVTWVEDFARGLADAVKGTGVGVVGGDLSSGEQIVVAVTAHGYLQGSAVTRNGAQPGNVIAIAGTLGYSAAGLQALSTGGEESEFTRIYRAPEPPLGAGIVAQQAGATAMMDVSDGLVRDAGRMAKASQVTMALSRAHLDPFAVKVGSWDHVLYGGEDHSLLACFPAETPVPDGFVPIGRVESCDEPVVTLDGERLSGGWDHFQSGN